MLQRAQERVGVVQRAPVVPSDVAPLGEPGESTERGRRTDHLVGAAVHHLQQLYGELHVAQPARAELELALGVVDRDVVEHPAAHRLDLLDEALALCRRPDHRLDDLVVLPAELHVACDRAGLEQGLELPGLRPALVVAAVAGDRAHQRSRLALRSQVGVDGPDRALGGVLRADLHQRRGELGGRLQRLPLVLGRLGPVPRLGHEDHVHVADVVELVAAALAHRDHGEPAAARVLADLGARDGECRVQRSGGEVRELGGGVVDPEVVSEVARREPEQHPAVLHPQGVQGFGVLHGRHRLRFGGIGPDCTEQPLADGVRRRAGRPERGVGELVPVLGMLAQVLAQRLAGPEHARATSSRCPRRRPPPRAARPGPPLRRPGPPARTAPGRGRSCARSAATVAWPRRRARPTAAALGRSRGNRAAPGCPRSSHRVLPPGEVIATSGPRPQMTGSIRSRSKAETWPRYSSHSARLLRRKNS